MTEPDASTTARRWFWAALALTAAQLWLTQGQTIFVIGNAAHDDQLFIRLAQHLAEGRWLGPYDQLTLAKGPAYPLFIAGAFLLGLPLFLAQHLLYAAACAALVRACRPRLASAAGRFWFYALLLWNPMSFDASSMGRVLRQHLQVPLTLLILAGLVALLLRRERPLSRNWPWALVAGVSGGLFWLTREDAVWLLPAALVLAATLLVAAWREGGRTGHALRSLVFAGAVGALPVLAVCTMNLRHYGWFGTVEFRSREFQDAYGALTRIQTGPVHPKVPVPREARAAAYTVSPAFAELRPFLEGDIGRNWAEASADLTGLPAEERQVGGGWFMWALRDAVAATPHGRSAAASLAAYSRIAGEINTACSAGRLPAGPTRSGFMPVLQPGQTAEVARTWLEFALFTARFSRFSARAPDPVGSEEEIGLFRDLTRSHLVPAGADDPTRGPAQAYLDIRKTDALQAIGKSLRAPLFWLILVAHGLAVVRVAQCLRVRSGGTFALLLAATAWTGASAALLVQALVNATSFPVLSISSFAVVYPLWLLFAGAIIWDVLAAWRRRPAIQMGNRAASAEPEPDIQPPPAPSRWMWLAGAGALLPFLLWYSDFSGLFWFGDDLFLVDQIAEMGFWGWCGHLFSENFVPLFKFLWGGALLAGGGSYLAMLWLLWLTHALNTALLGRVMHRAGFPPAATLPALAVFALTPANIETLGWSVQWSAVLATTFLLLGLDWHLAHDTRPHGLTWRRHPPLVLCSAASAVCFSRGVLTGGVLAAALLWPAIAGRRLSWWRVRQPGALLVLLPSVAVSLVIALGSEGNHRHLEGQAAAVLEFAAGFFLWNPMHQLAGATAESHTSLVYFGAAKLAVIALALWSSTGRVRLLLVALLVYDLGNAALLGIGRHHTGLLNSTSSRYCYSSLIATLPSAAWLFALLLGRLAPRARLAAAVSSLCLVAVAAACLAGWPAGLKAFTGWRGLPMRELLQAPRTTDPAARVPALDFMHVERAKALQRTFNLH